MFMGSYFFKFFLISLSLIHFCACLLCYPGSYVDESSNECMLCPMHWISTVRDAKECVVCPSGFHQPWEGFSECMPCPAGSYTFDRGYDARAVYELNPQYFGCHPCPPGTFSDVKASTSCTKCPEGYHSGPGATVCHECMPGYFPNEEKNACIPCPPGTFWTQNPTPFVVPNGQISFMSGCFSCPSGSYQESEGSLHCDPCPSLHTTIAVRATGKEACITYQLSSPTAEFNFHDHSEITIQNGDNFFQISGNYVQALV